MIPLQDRLGKEDRDVAVERRILHFGNQVIPLAEKRPSDEIVQMGDGQFHFAVQAGFPGRKCFRVMSGTVPAQIVQDGPDIPAVLQGSRIRRAVRNQLEVNRLVFSGNDGKGARDIAADFCGQSVDILLFHFQGIKAGRVGGSPDEGSVEIDRDVGDDFAGDRIRHLSLHPGRLGGNQEGQEQRQG